ncbi:MAG: response regulator [Pyrinomonadaceae bacterium]|nr:response regulator [Pyrinomonadaceae bacterium]
MLSNRRLLLADDSIAIQKVVELTFDGEGLQVTSVGDGEQAIRQLEESPPDILLADVFMPGRNGYEVCEHVKRSERLRSIPVMLLVGTFEPFDEAEARRVGADDVLTKPFQSIRELVGKVGSLLGNRSNEQKATGEEKATQEAQLQRTEAEDRQSKFSDGDDSNASVNERASINDTSQASAFGDPATVDDQMIEVSTAEEFGRGSESQPRPTTPLDRFGVAETAFAKQNQQRDLMPEDEPQVLTTGALQNDKEAYISAAPPQQSLTGERQVDGEYRVSARPTYGSRITHAEQADEALLDLGDVETPRPALEADDFILDLTDGAPVLSAPRAAPALDHEAMDIPAPFMPETLTEMTTELPPLPPPQQHPDFNEAETSESDGSRAYSTQELEERDGFGDEVSRPAPLSAREFEQAVAASPQLESAVAEPEFMDEIIASPSAQRAETEAIDVNQLSPEMIDMIARRAVEHLSDAVVREIAWEVVPQLAELIIKRRLEEENSGGS